MIETYAIADEKPRDILGDMKRMMAQMPPPTRRLMADFGAATLMKPITIEYERQAGAREMRFDLMSRPLAQPMTFMGFSIVEHDLPPVPVIERQRPRRPSKRAGRRGTRRAWKRAHPPRDVIIRYDEPPIYLIGDTAIASPKAVAMIKASAA